MRKYLTYIAVEDQPSLTIVKKLLTEQTKFHIFSNFPMSGCGYLKKNMRKFNELSKQYVVIVVTDTDKAIINPEEFKQRWLNVPPNNGLIFELAIIEIESWILADTSNFSKYFSTPKQDFYFTDEITDPKQKIFNIVKKSKDKEIREAILPLKGASIGPAYNITIADFIRNHWDSSNAIKRSKSLEHFISILNNFSDPSEKLQILHEDSPSI